MWWWLACKQPDEPPPPTDPPGETSGTPSVPTTDPPPDDPPEPIDVDPVDPAEVCYPGPDGDFDVCLPVAGLDVTPQEYEYPDPLYGLDQYRPPIRYLWLEELDGDTELAANFVLSEIAVPSKGPFGVVQPHAIASLQQVRDELGALIVNSGYRSPSYNAGVGGATWSRHMYGDAFDLDPVSASLEDLAATCDAYGAGYVGVYETHIHCDWRDDPVDTVFFGGAPLVRAAAAPRPLLSADLQHTDGWWTAPAEGWDEGEPLRVWRAYDVDDQLIDEWIGRTYRPPAGAARMEVEVGLAVLLSESLVR